MKFKNENYKYIGNTNEYSETIESSYDENKEN